MKYPKYEVLGRPLIPLLKPLNPGNIEGYGIGIKILIDLLLADTADDDEQHICAVITKNIYYKQCLRGYLVEE